MSIYNQNMALLEFWIQLSTIVESFLVGKNDQRSTDPTTLEAHEEIKNRQKVI